MDEQTTVAHGPEHTLERLIFFSDAVFAIAITLLVIDLHAPRLPRGSPDVAYWNALAEQGPEFAGFFISFFVIGSFWAGHHRMMALASHFAPTIATPNLMLLASVVAIPFFTTFASINSAMRVPVFCYCGWLLLAALLNRWLQHIVTTAPVVDEEASREALDLVHARGNAVVLGTLCATLVSLLLPVFGQLTLATIPLWRLLLMQLARRRRRKIIDGRAG